jgi:hypothetical protein
VETLPAVANAALSIGIPFRSSLAIRFKIDGRDSLPRLSSGGPYANGVSPTYFATLGTRVLQGRAFSDADHAGAPHVAIINASFARIAWPNQSSLGACLHIGTDPVPCFTIVGVVDDIHRLGVIEAAQAQYYVPLAQWPGSFGAPAMLIRTRSAYDIQRTTGDVRRALQGVSPSLSYPLVESFANFIDPQLESWMLGARMFSLFGGLAFVVALIGLYGLLTHNIAQRRHELGVRAALGARADDIAALVVGHGLRIIIIGLVAGLFTAALLAGRMGTLLFGVEPRDLATYGAITLLAGSLAIGASLIPARRAAGVDPMEALRAE